MYDNTIFVILLMVIVFIYMLPALVAYSRDIPQRWNVAVANVVFGWTLIGWIGIFLWAALAQSRPDEPT